MLGSRNSITKLGSRRVVRQAVLALAVLGWTVAIILGSRIVLTYENTPGMPGVSPGTWPEGSHVEQSRTAFTLVLLAHPDCPCTEASIAELESVIAAARGRLICYVILSKPNAGAKDIRGSAVSTAATRIPRVTVIYDLSGFETSRFGGHVSGQTMLYDPNGRLVFSGGITSSRGHQGDNDGANAILRRIDGDANALASTPVFGCSLHNPRADGQNEDPSWKN